MNQSDELKNRAERLGREADEISEKIRSAEALLCTIPATTDVSWAYLKWDNTSKRIVSTSYLIGERPLIECPLRERISRQSEISGLIDAVLMETESFMEKMRAVQ